MEERKTMPAPPLPIGDRNENPNGISLISLIAEDFRQHDKDYLSQGFWALFWHRIGNARMDIKYKFARMPITLAYRIMFKLTEWICGIKLSHNVKVGRRVRIDHFGGIIIGARSIGNDVTIRQNTTFGIAGKWDLNAKPIIEDNVDIGAGAVIVGNIIIGRGSFIGANAVVTKSIPPFSVAVGVPARIVKKMTNQFDTT